MYLQKYDLKGRVAVVTGAGQGIGFCCAQALGEAGAKVIVAEMVADRVSAAVDQLKGLGIEAAGVQLDVTKSAQVDEIAGKVANEHGPAHILVNNAGVAKSDVRAEDTSDEHWRFHMDVNLDGLFWCCRAFGRQMLAAGRGSIVNVGDPRRAGQCGRTHLHRDPAHQVRHRGESRDVPDLARDDAHGPGRPTRGDRLGGAVPGLRRGEPADRQHRARRCRLHLLVRTR